MAAISVNKEVRDAGKKFEDDFNFSEMETMIHRFPAALGSELSGRYPHMVAPRFVSIGPYHHGKDHLKNMEEVKKAAAYYLCQRMGVEPEAARDAVLAVADVAHSLYYYPDDDATTVPAVEEEKEEDDSEAGTKTKADASFVAMMFRDACFLLLYLDARNRSHGRREDGVVNMSMRRFLFSNRDSINCDILLLENQLPWVVVKALLDLAGEKSAKLRDDLYQGIGNFIAGISNSFRITTFGDDADADACATYEWDDETNPPAHLLALLRRHKTDQSAESEAAAASAANGTDDHVAVQVNGDDDLQSPLITRSRSVSAPTPALAAAAAARVTSISSMSPANLQEIGIQLTPSPTAACSDMGLEKGPVLSRLTVVPLSLSDTRASYLVNMAALEICTESRFDDDDSKTAVCSYLSILAFFMVAPDDVRKLRSMGLLHGSLSDGDILAFFNTISKHIPNGKHFATLMCQIQDYKEKRPVRTTLYRWLYNNTKTIMAVVSIILTLIGLYQGLRGLIQSK